MRRFQRLTGYDGQSLVQRSSVFSRIRAWPSRLRQRWRTPAPSMAFKARIPTSAQWSRWSDEFPFSPHEQDQSQPSVGTWRRRDLVLSHYIRQKARLIRVSVTRWKESVLSTCGGACCVPCCSLITACLNAAASPPLCLPHSYSAPGNQSQADHDSPGKNARLTPACFAGDGWRPKTGSFSQLTLSSACLVVIASVVLGAAIVTHQFQ